MERVETYDLDVIALRKTALDVAQDIGRGFGDDTDNVLKNAELIFQWLKSGNAPAPAPIAKAA